ncbi:hypothetical protein MTAT_18980 [Moorella thermoacetica]|uniref:Uncharacterized protein n=1 Tax=Neomoorella thermoacetica TaxID=1525 RepID=A0AAC9MV82_NEOTH|nr:hypothetical protein [Moorella thermoacetica]AOQ24555.1 hypothetical protein Maut_02125 [Moorella thermoacetica]TYL12656.1 hypothetical protein MTAT_18980 [Moorella thermoacetica]
MFKEGDIINLPDGQLLDLLEDGDFYVNKVEIVTSNTVRFYGKVYSIDGKTKNTTLFAILENDVNKFKSLRELLDAGWLEVVLE